MTFKNTKEFAADNLVRPQSVRARLCRFGSYFGVVPVKLENGRLGWPVAPAVKPKAAG